MNNLSELHEAMSVNVHDYRRAFLYKNTRTLRFTWYIFRFIMTFLFTDERVKRVVVEPDERNHKIHGLNRRAGFEYERTVKLPHKTACLAFCNYEQFSQAIKNQP